MSEVRIKLDKRIAMLLRTRIEGMIWTAEQATVSKNPIITENDVKVYIEINKTIVQAINEALEEADLPVSFGNEQLNKKLDEAVEDVKNGKVVVVESGKLNEFLEGL